MKRILQTGLFLLVFFFTCSSLMAEPFVRIEYGDTVYQLKLNFPNSAVYDLKPGWCSQYESIWAIDGTGFGGSVTVFTSDFTEVIFEKNNVDMSLINSENAAEIKEIFSFVVGIRYLPDNMTLAKLVQKYGMFEDNYISDDGYPVVSWESLNISAVLADDKSTVTSIEFYPNAQEEEQILYKVALVNNEFAKELEESSQTSYNYGYEAAPAGM